MQHQKSLGDGVVLKKVLPHDKSSVHKNAQSVQTNKPVEMKHLNPLIVKCLKKSPVEKELQTLRVSLAYGEDSVTVVPTRESQKGWQEKSRKLVEGYVADQFDTAEVRITEKASVELLSLLTSIQEESTVAYSFSNDKKLLRAAGDKNAIKKLKSEVSEVVESLAMSSEVVKLPPREYAFISQMKRSQFQYDFGEAIKFEFDDAKHSISLKGATRDVKRFKDSLLDSKAHSKVEVELTNHSVRYLQSQLGQQQLGEYLRLKHCSVACYFHQNKSLWLLCSKDLYDTTVVVAQQLEGAVVCQPVSIPALFHELLGDPEEYKKLCRELEQQEKTKIQQQRSKADVVTVVGFQDGVNKTCSVLKEFIHEKCKINKSVSLETGQWKVFNRLMKEEWDSILSKIKEMGVDFDTVVPKSKAAKQSVHLRGETEQVDAAIELITSLQKSIASVIEHLDRPGLLQFLKEDNQVQMAVSGIESNQSVVIEINKDQSAQEELSSDGGTDNWQAKMRKVCLAQTEELKKVVVWVGDITECKVDVIVNAANEDLKHIGGVAMAISKRGGPVIQSESDKHVKKSGKLEVGSACLMKSVGKLPCKALVHTVGPKWIGGGPKDCALLAKCCTKSLQKARDYQSIAFPAISSGVFGFPLEACAETLVRAAADFSKRDSLSNLSEINFVLHTPADARVFTSVMQQHFPNAIITGSGSGSGSGSGPTKAPPTRAALEEEVSRGPTDTGTGTSAATALDCVKLTRGSILDAQVRTS